MIDSSCGIDPGVTTGMAFLDYENGKLVGKTLLQCDADSAAVVLKGMLASYYRTDLVVPLVSRRIGSVEAFREGRGAGTQGIPAAVTRQLVFELTELLQLFGYTVHIRPAADVKPWSSDRRLVAAQVAKDPKKINGEFRHAYDAARHSIYGSKTAGLIQDPLRKKES